MNNFDVVIVGGGLGGVAAALAAARLGARSVLVCETDWLGGQLTSQAIPLDEHPWIESTGRNASYALLRARVREWFRRGYPLTAAARAETAFNPGRGNIGPLTFEPRVGALVLEELLAPHVSAGLVEIVRSAVVVGADVRGDAVVSVTVAAADGSVGGPRGAGGAGAGELRELRGTTFLDATDLGDLLELAGAEHVIGAESRAQTGEPHALDGEPDPRDQQAFTWAMVLGIEPGEDHTIARPRDYELWRDYRTPVWPGSLLSFEVRDFVTHRTRERPLFRSSPSAGGIHYDLWHARRVLAAANFEPGWPGREATAAAWPMQDYWRAPLLGPDVGEAERAEALEGARQLSLSLLHWLQTEAPRHDGDGVGYPELRPRGDLTGTPDGLAKQPYIREGRRIVAETTVVEQQIGVEARPGARGAEPFADTVGVGAYRIDLHPSSSGRDTVDVDSWPFQIPLGALLPVRLENLLPAAKNIGTTHVTNGAYRVHPVEWAIGEAAAALAVFAGVERCTPRAVRADAERLERFQTLLAGRLGVQLEWPDFGPLTPLRRWGYVAEEGDELAGALT
ncbi:FAD-dependent oxidoreductase [Conexibacter sp. JD483]|uniref:FAD-dependent oxidoreductase n=1 Tax=unclassified Conexibacter TaxID=2627773 RepID=UPI00272135AA|nr:MULTISPECIES: FAD-dependent oxidoreductase [unclassified Conexibacter]MDO8186516.1 FAD-dependent oxidoreductase [Conexibacter sp. CPCC 205706]MDO8200085.1 FAD-dependent oxidoreductase [Conexibacter sp. CPCC 205762]MDR9372183.1 FAD-dependent oxidoreductase [Conexibacter sp. JD483]